MKFRPCIDLHEGCVKQIVGGTLTDDAGKTPETNFTSDKSAGNFAALYQEDGLQGGHVIMLGKGNEEAALEALGAFPDGMHVGGGVTPENAQKYLDAGASHVIVTSYVFRDGTIDFDKLHELESAVGKERLVLDLSCRRRSNEGESPRYFVVTDRWQKFTDYEITQENLETLAQHCSEFLVHGVDVEGLRVGIIGELVEMLGRWSPIPVTYAGGARSVEDLELVKLLGRGRVDLTIGSALDIFGGSLSYDTVVKWHYANLHGDDVELSSISNPKERLRCMTARTALEADRAAVTANAAFRTALKLASASDH
ncbi:1-5-phosphoribosyl-5-5-phosphoribosylaminomethylideneamino imidazole-4-carboxamide isomerase [Hondaea fermentalgiana]|uniref:1-(5-phosphoribosyl)-5-[(5-phosphoribosylamino)methylideneamino]imidazole-4-carboxamideisomerase n=1 Tax=Hondaea fermentalgiana TaxID=2315210 RepID=A0A2R5G2D0_9STRA|nr:1-5-phosphoribosyl-5-5-phosphoribosylaminomethylideneamino imidazole-4-carboxamide isomerase [Hondaea fermentalgiana]|eukprot:GBG25187.1 1-5-phosphoribosyl-5-5-phosphoribosylaminomethylideneamino imidazole-4-carboxamide isomerase [Hondaea fermentalgiana]